MRKVFLDELPRKGEKLGLIDWKNSVGYKVPFIYDDIEDWVDIIDYKKGGTLRVAHKNKTIDIKASGFRKCEIGRLLNKITKDFKIEIGQVFKDDKRDLIITDRKYKQKLSRPDSKGRIYTTSEKLYKYKCNKCGFNCGEHYRNGEYKEEYWVPESTILRGCGCSCCHPSPQLTVLGINTIWDTDRWMCDLGVSEEDAKKYTKSSGAKIEVACPDCGTKKIKSINKLYENKSMGCICSDNISYPEKIIMNILKKLDINFKNQLSKTTFEWCGDKRYDFYIPEYNCIIETHGRQHYERTKGFYKTLEEEQENDRLKEQLAKENGIENYIVIDCRYSDVEWIKNRILETAIAKMFDLSKINWVNIGVESMTSNIIKKVCDYWNQKEHWETTKDLSNHFCINQGVIIGYLKKGANLGFCEYDSYKELMKTARKICGHNKRVVKIFKDGMSLGIFESASELERRSEELFGVKLLHGSISEVCSGKKPQYKGFTFKYTEDSE